MTQHRSKSKGHKKKDPELDLSVGQVLAASGATTLGALLVKVLDIWGTILGTAVLSVCTSIGAVLILRTMRRTSERVKRQITVLSRAAETRIQAGATVDLSAETVRIEPVEETEEAAGDGSGGAHSRKRTLVAIVVSSVSVFAMTMAALFLFGAVAEGDPTKYFFEQSPSTVYITEDSTEEPSDGSATDGETETDAPTDEATGGEETEETPTDEPSEDAPTEDPTTEEPTEEATDERAGASESPSAESEAATETPTE